MTHLSVDEIIDFVSLKEMNDDAVKLSAVVNGHIRHCEKCFELVNAFQMIYDEFETLKTKEAFKKYVKTMEICQIDENTAEVQGGFDKIDNVL